MRTLNSNRSDPAHELPHLEPEFFGRFKPVDQIHTAAQAGESGLEPNQEFRFLHPYELRDVAGPEHQSGQLVRRPLNDIVRRIDHIHGEAPARACLEDLKAPRIVRTAPVRHAFRKKKPIDVPTQEELPAVLDVKPFPI
jgi:hypothetical protein